MISSQTEFNTKKGYDLVILLTVLILAVFGLIMVYSASYITSFELRGDAFFYLKRQLMWFVLGLVGMFFTAKFNYWRWRKILPILIVTNFVLLLLVFVPGIGVEVNGATRWISLAGFTLQPSEFTKLVAVIFAAAFFTKNNLDMDNFWQSSFIPLAFTSASFVLIFAQPDLGTALAIMAATCIVVFAAGIPFRQVFSLCLLSVPMLVYLTISAPWRVQRIFSFLDPWADPLRSGYHVIQSLYALGSGGFSGVRLGFSRQKLYYLPEPQNDFIFAIIGEELGFLGATTIMLIFLILIWRGYKIAASAQDTFGSLLATGIIGIIAVQVLINVGVVTGSIPVTGINLPFISAGGSSLFFMMCAMGVLMNISRHGKLDL